MICCINCFKDIELRTAIEMVGHKGDCPICKNINTWIYDSDEDSDKTNVGEMLDSILGLYVPESKLSISYPETEKLMIEDRLSQDWNIFAGSIHEIKRIVQSRVLESMDLDSRITVERVGIPQLFDENYLENNSIIGKYSWDIFKKSLRNENRFHSKYINLEILESVLSETETIIPTGTKFYRARVSDKKGFAMKDMGAPPDDVASPGRVNSKGQSCLYLCSNKMTTIKEIRAHAFDYVTIATFKLQQDVKVVDLSSIVHSSPFSSDNDKVAFLLNERSLRQIQNDMTKPMSRLDSELDYLPTQYISDFAKFLGYNGVKYFSTFDKTSYNVALFDSSVCDCVYRRNFLVGDLEYKITAV
jgi:hypothetical protein